MRAKVAGPSAVLLRGCRTGGLAAGAPAPCGNNPTNMGKNWGVRTARYAYVEYAGGYRQLFDVGADPGEVRNLAGNPAYAATLLTLHQRLVALRSPPS